MAKEQDQLNAAIQRAWEEEVHSKEPEDRDVTTALERGQNALAASFARLENRVKKIEDQHERDKRAVRRSR